MMSKDACGMNYWRCPLHNLILKVRSVFLQKKKKHPLQYGDVFLLFYLKNHFTFLSTCRDTFAQMCTVLDTQMQKPKPVKSTENYSAPYSKHIDAVHSKSWGLFVREFWVRQRFFIGHQLKYFLGPQESRLRSKYCTKKHNIFVLFYFFLYIWNT